MFACTTKDVEYPQNFPLVVTDGVDDITTTGSTFHGHAVNDIGDITSYGFEWYAIENSKFFGRSESSGAPTANSFSYRAHALLPTDYYVQAYVKTTTLTIRGSSIKFHSPGGIAPLIDSFSPTEGIDGDVVTIAMKNFNYVPESTIVKLGDSTCQIVSGSDTEMKVRVPMNERATTVGLTLITPVSISTTAQLFKYIIPAITSIETPSARVGDVVTVDVMNFDLATNPTISLGAKEVHATVLSPTKLQFRVPNVNPGNARPVLRSTVPNSFGTTSLKVSISESALQVKDTWDTYDITSVPITDALNCRSVVITNLMYIVGKKQTYTFNPASNQWLRKTDFPGTSRDYAFAVESGGKLYYGFGENAGVAMKDVWVYDPADDTWQSVMDAPITARSSPAAVSINDNIYIGFGSKTATATLNSDYYHDLWKFNPSDNSWTEVINPFQNIIKSTSVAFAIGDKAYFYNDRSDFYQFDPSNSSWTQKNTPPALVTNQPAITTGSTAVVFGIPQDAFTEPYEYDPVADEWIPRASSVDLNRYGEAAGYINGKIYFGLGRTIQNVYIRDMWDATIHD